MLLALNRTDPSPPNTPPRLLERFYRADESREHSAHSNGLGLSMVATIMQLHNRAYSVSSSEVITCFELFFRRGNWMNDVGPTCRMN
jgi:two-component system heavy metal sensor histidine kinase CusS